MRRLHSYHLLVQSIDFLNSLVHRRVSFRYSGRGLQFDLSTALFSSACVDTGTVTLLRALERPVKDLQPACVLDMGSGTGTLGIALASATGAELYATDRDALAVWFTSKNAGLNKIAPVDAWPALEVHSPFSERVRQTPDIAVCNLPAKAGEPVLRHMISLLPGLVSGRGFAGVVVVTTLAQLLISELRRLDARVLVRRESKNHVAVVYADVRDGQGKSLPVRSDGPNDASDNLLPAVYARGENSFVGPYGDYRLKVAHNLPEFNSLGYGTELAFRLIRNTAPAGRILVWGVGQGHLAVGGIQSSRRVEILVADRDLLAITATTANLAQSHQRATVRPLVAPGLGAAADLSGADSVDWMIVHSHPEPGSHWAGELTYAAEKLLDHGGRLLVVSRSTSISRLTPVIRRSFSQIHTLRHRGYRADLLIRKR
ncbi:MAG: methyltransferase [Spirochaetia bacterium]